MTNILRQLKLSSLKTRRKQNILILMYKALAEITSIPRKNFINQLDPIDTTTHIPSANYTLALMYINTVSCQAQLEIGMPYLVLPSMALQ